MAEPTWHKVVVSATGSVKSRVTYSKAGLAMSGERFDATTGTEGLSAASRGGNAVAGYAGVAVSRGVSARCGGEGMAYGYDGVTTVAGDGGVAFASLNANAEAGDAGVAAAKYGGGNPIEAISTAKGVSVMRFHAQATSRNGRAVTGQCGVAIAWDGGAVQGGMGALLVIQYTTANGDCRFTYGIVDGEDLAADTPYWLDANYRFSRQPQ